MSARLIITMDDDLYARLKREVPSKKRNAFIAGAVRAKLHPDAKALDVAYQAASKEQWRKGWTRTGNTEVAPFVWTDFLDT